MPRVARKPAYLLHAATRQARVRIEGKDYYLGRFGTPESKEQYRLLIRRWRAGLPIFKADASVGSQSVDELVLDYLDHAVLHYRKGGRPTSELKCIKLAVKHLLAVHGTTRVRRFGPRALMEVRRAMVRAGYARKSINRHIGRIVRVFDWGVAEETVPAAIPYRLGKVEGLRAGRSEAREGDPVKAVPQERIDAVEPYVTRPVWGAIRVQLLTGMRPGEVLALRACDLNMSGPIWEYAVREHKTSHLGKERLVFLGPKAQAIISEFLPTDTQAYLFNPEAGRDEYLQQFSGPGRKVKVGTSGRQATNRYSTISYLVSIRRACERAFGMPRDLQRIPPASEANKIKDAAERRAFHDRRNALLKAAAEWRRENCWTPNQLRHSAATLIRREAGLEVARCVLGHASAVTSEIYAEQDWAKARELMAMVG